MELDITAFDNLESKLLDPLEEEPLQINSGSIETSYQWMQARAPPKSYSGQIIYGFDLISRRLLNNLSQSNSNLATPETSFSLA